MKNVLIISASPRKGKRGQCLIWRKKYGNKLKIR